MVTVAGGLAEAANQQSTHLGDESVELGVQPSRSKTGQRSISHTRVTRSDRRRGRGHERRAVPEHAQREVSVRLVAVVELSARPAARRLFILDWRPGESIC